MRLKGRRTTKGIKNAEEIVSNPWIDAIVFGPGDLAADMSLHGKWEHQHVISAMEKWFKSPWRMANRSNLL